MPHHGAQLERAVRTFVAAAAYLEERAILDGRCPPGVPSVDSLHQLSLCVVDRLDLE